MSNIANLKAASEVETVIDEQGWTERTYLGVLCDFITLNQLWPQVLEYAKDRAAEENEQAP